MNHTRIRFTKMHGLGNDFVIIDTTEQSVDVTQLPIKQLADRHLGIGFDQLLLIEPATEAHFFCRIFNADGSEAEQCGNGLRCVARFIHDKRQRLSSTLTIATKAGVFPINIQDHTQIQVNMGMPIIQSTTSPTTACFISLGNPHAIIKVDNLETIDTHQLSLASVNVGFVHILDRHQAALRTIERGAGETLACGSNACAAAVAGITNQWLASPVTIHYALGCLLVEWEGKGKPVYLTGPTMQVFDGEFVLPSK